MQRKTFAPVVFLIGLSQGAAAAEVEGDARATVARWVESQQLIARERREWQDGKQLLESRIALLDQEIATLTRQLEELGQSDSATAAERGQAVVAESAVRGSETALRQSVVELEGEITRLESRLPGPLREKVAPLYARMPDDPQKTQVSLAERFQNVLGILNEVSKFDTEITMVSEVRTLSDGKPSEVRTIYLGLGQAYYLSAGGEAGIGVPVEDGWQWTPADELAPQVLAAVEILQNKSKPQFVPLPVSIR